MYTHVTWNKRELVPSSTIPGHSLLLQSHFRLDPIDDIRKLFKVGKVLALAVSLHRRCSRRCHARHAKVAFQLTNQCDIEKSSP